MKSVCRWGESYNWIIPRTGNDELVANLLDGIVSIFMTETTTELNSHGIARVCDRRAYGESGCQNNLKVSNAM